MPVSLLSPYSRLLDRIEFFVYFGWVAGLVLLLPALFLARIANARGVNGWLVTIALGAALGAAIAEILAMDAGFILGSAAMGALYGLCFWAIAHGLAVRAGRKTTS